MAKDELILTSDEQGNFLGEYIPKMVGHTGEGRHHLAITVFIFNSQGQVLLQNRKHQIFNHIWDNTGSTHQLHLADGTDETDEQATHRCLDREYGIKNVPLQNHGGFNYFAKYQELCENEHCKLLTGIYDGEIKLNSEVAYDYKWQDISEYLSDITQNPQSFTPWAVEATKMLQNQGFFDQLAKGS